MLGYFYFSGNCSYCQSLMKLMENHKLFQYFKCECLDKKEPTELAKLPCTEVPALVLISNENGNQRIMTHEGPKAFTWIKQFLQARRSASIKNAEENRKLIQSDNTKTMLKEGLFEYCPEELGGVSDNYCIVRDDINMALPKTFIQYNPNGIMEEERIMTVPVGKIDVYKAQSSINAVYGKDTNKLISDIENTRRNQDNEIKTMHSQKTLNTVIDQVSKSGMR